MIKSILKSFLSMDIFGVDVPIYYKYKSRYNTHIGATLSITSVDIMITFAIYFIND